MALYQFFVLDSVCISNLHLRATVLPEQLQLSKDSAVFLCAAEHFHDHFVRRFLHSQLHHEEKTGKASAI